MSTVSIDRQVRSPSAAAAASSRLEQCARELLTALERDDGEAAADALAALVAQDAQSLRGRLGRLAEVLHRRVAELPRAADPGFGGADDAVHSLDHVSRLTEEAAHRCLDLVEAGQSLLARLEAGPDAVALAELRRVFNELALAQGYQDLSGQILRRVRGLLQGIETSLQRLAAEPAAATAASGPAVPGVDGPRSSQSDADDLLAELGI